MNVVHVFPYTPKISGGHSNAIRGFIACQRAKGIHAVGIALLTMVMREPYRVRGRQPPSATGVREDRMALSALPTAPNTPGNAATAPGSAFNPAGHAGTVYAGEQPQNSRNTASVSQYDVACSHQR